MTRNGIMGFFYGKSGAKKSWHMITTNGDDNGRRILSIYLGGTHGFCLTRVLMKITNLVQCFFIDVQIAVVWLG